MDSKPFAPHYGTTQTLAANATSQSSPVSQANESLRVVNAGNNVAFIRIGDGAQTATTGDFPIMPGMASTIRKPLGNNGANPVQIGYISAGGTTLYVTTGNGGV